MNLLQGKTAIVTGATRGIGKSIAEVFVKNGANVAFTYASSVEKAKALEEELGQFGKVKGYQSDASDYEAAQKLVEDVIAEFGQVDIVINNAGITKDNLLMRMSAEDFEKVIQTNLNSAFNLTKAVIKPMMKQRSGSIVNMSSIVGIKGNAGQANYAASKAGVIGLTKSAAREMAPYSVTVNAIAPGFIKSDMTDKLTDEIKDNIKSSIPMRKIGEPKDVANLVKFLANDETGYITGQVINVDGGMVMY